MCGVPCWWMVIISYIIYYTYTLLYITIIIYYILYITILLLYIIHILLYTIFFLFFHTPSPLPFLSSSSIPLLTFPPLLPLIYTLLFRSSPILPTHLIYLLPFLFIPSQYSFYTCRYLDTLIYILSIYLLFPSYLLLFSSSHLSISKMNTSIYL